MANAQAVCASFKTEILNGIHAFSTTVTRGSTAADSFKGALYTTAGSIGAGTTAYSATNEVSHANYTAGGNSFTWIAPASTSNITYTTPSASFTWTNVTFTTDCLLLYNTTQGNKAVASYAVGTIGVGVSPSAGNLTLTMPTNDNSTGLLRLN